jgi:ubiquitin
MPADLAVIVVTFCDFGPAFEAVIGALFELMAGLAALGALVCPLDLIGHAHRTPKEMQLAPCFGDVFAIVSCVGLVETVLAARALIPFGAHVGTSCL